MSLTIRRKLYLSFAVMIALVAAMGVVGVGFIDALAADSNSMYEVNRQGAAHLASAKRGLWELRFGIANYAQGDPAQRQKIRGDTDKWLSQVNAHLKSYATSARSPEELALAAELVSTFNAHVDLGPGRGSPRSSSTPRSRRARRRRRRWSPRRRVSTRAAR